jgi:hypothetical protein
MGLQVGRRGEDADVQLAKLAGRERRVVESSSRDTDSCVDAGAHEVEVLPADPDVDLDVRLAPHEAGERLGQNGGSKIDRRRHHDPPARLARRIEHRSERRVEVRVRFAQSIAHRLSGVRQRDPTRCAEKEPVAHPLLEPRDGAAHRRLLHAEALCGGRKTPELGDREKRGNQVEGDCSHGATVWSRETHFHNMRRAVSLGHGRRRPR